MRLIIITAILFLNSSVSVHADACSNVHMLGSTGKFYFHDEISKFGGRLDAKGVFLRPNALDEKHQSEFNLSSVHCDKTGEWGANGLINPEITCDISRSYVSPSSNPDRCYLDFLTEGFIMKETNNNIIIGSSVIEVGCYQETLIINRDLKQVSISYTRKNSKDCTSIEQAAFAEILQECPKDRQY